MPREVFVAGQVLTAAELNVVSDQSVMVFAGTAARGSAIPSPSEGMVTYRSDDDLVEVYNGSSFVAVGAGQILQVVSTTLTSTFTVSTTTFTSVTGLTATITPSSATSKILVSGMLSVNVPGANHVGAYRLMRDSTAIGIGDAASTRNRATGSWFAGNSTGVGGTGQWAPNFLDSPATTSAITYSVEIASTATITLNTSVEDADTPLASRTASTLTLMEVTG